MRKPMTKEAAEMLSRGLETARGLGALGARLHFEQGENVGCLFEGGRLKNANSRQSVSFDVEVLLDGRRARAMGNDLRDLDEVVRRAVGLARIGSQAHFDAYPAPGDVVDVQTHSPDTAELSREEMIRAGEAVLAKLKEYDPDLFIEGGAQRHESEGVLVTSGGVRHETFETSWNLGFYAQRTQGTDMLFAGFGRHGVRMNDQWDADLVAQRVLDDLRCGETIVDAPVGKVTAVLPPEVLRRLLSALLLGVDGRNVAKGDSPLRGRLGERILDENFTLLDDPHTDFTSGARSMDSCGVPTRVTPIVERGVLKSFLYDLDTAGLASVEPTGHDGCSPCSPSVLPGDKPHEQLLAEVSEGLVLKQLIGFGQGNLINGDFSANVGLGFRVSDGQMTGRVKNTMVAGSFYDLFSQNVLLSSDVDPVYRMPWAVIEGVSVSAAQGA
jgi:PmbA protein